MLPIPKAILAFIVAFNVLVFGWIAYSALAIPEGQIECMDDRV